MPVEMTATAGLTLGAALTVVGLLISFIMWRRRGAASGLRGVAWSLLPLAAGLLGLMNAVWQFGASIVGIIVGLALNPMVWAGVALTGVAVVLYIVSGFMRSKGVGVKAPAKSEKASKGDDGGGPPAGGQQQVGGGAPKQADATSDLSDFGDIEELLRKRGIE